MTGTREQLSGFNALLEAGATELRKAGTFSVELSSGDLEQMMRQILAQSEEAMQGKGITAKIKELGVRISHGTSGIGTGEVHAKVAASKKVGFLNPGVTITADFALENDGQNPGFLKTARLVVNPNRLFGVVEPMPFLAPYVEKINPTFQGVLAREMDKRGATVDGMQLAFTERDTLKVDLQGTAKTG